MKFKINVHKIGHVADLEIEAEGKADAAEKVKDLLGTDNGTYMLVVESPAPNICKTHLQQIIMAELAKPGYEYYFSDGLSR